MSRETDGPEPLDGEIEFAVDQLDAQIRSASITAIEVAERLAEIEERIAITRDNLARLRRERERR